MTSVTRMHAKLGQAMASGPRVPEEADIPNAVRYRRSLPAEIDMIETGDRLRSVDEAAVEHIAESMQHQGQLYPIQIRTIEPGRFRLLAGAHRLAAARKLGWTHIEAFLVDDLDEEESRLLEIDENLCRAELTQLDRCRFMRTRKEIYERLHPETKHGAHLKLPPWQHWKEGASPLPERVPSFVDNTAASTPWSPRTIARYARIGDSLSPELMDALSGTPIARRTRDLEDIADMDAGKQQDLLMRLQDVERPPVSLAALTTNPCRPSAPPKSNLDRLSSIWAKASKSDRRQFLKDILTAASEDDREDCREWLGIRDGS
ncbi:MAG: ParB N-terminal domain-containing protein [Alphaproteobacteria bacterium]|nr:ParB N-terminal domain-containing protein [Alphaproteobacteria bacterium]